MNRFDQRDHTETFVTGLCSDLEGKNAESIAYHFDLDRKTMQYLIGQSQWDNHQTLSLVASWFLNVESAW